LAREGGRQSSFWHWTHFENPALISPGSVMPSYIHLLENKLNFDAIQPHVRAAAFLGAPYTEEELENSGEVAYKQAQSIAAEIVAQGGPPNTFETQAVALIAYLQRVGTDLFRTEEKPKPEEEPAAEPQTEVAVATAP
jgi:cytochrome c oxidase cbb3-type subunit I/II